MPDKKRKSHETPLDKMTREQSDHAWDARMELRRITEDIIVHSGIADFFPRDSANWIEVSRELEEEKHSLLRAIEDYEKERRLYNALIEIEGERYYTKGWEKWMSNDWNPTKIISDVYRDFYKRN